MKWYKITEIENIPLRGSRTIEFDKNQVDIFRTSDNEVFALDHFGPHEKCWLSEGIIHGHIVTCTTLNIDVDLKTGKALGEGFQDTKTYEVKIEDNIVYLQI